MASTLNEVISVCSSKDLAVWKLVSLQLTKYIKADNYSLFVPDAEVSVFREVTHPSIQVYPESNIIGDLRNTILEYLEGDNKNRVNWYLQQFIKIAAIAKKPSEAIVLIWDADTLPLKSLNFIGHDNTLLFYTNTEYRASYFLFLERVFSIKKTLDFSFIAQCLPVKVSWIQEMSNELEAKYQMNWLLAILSQIDPREPAGFSEYETIGAYAYDRHRNECHFLKNPWCRTGVSLVGYPQTLSNNELQGLSHDFDFISFEKWDRPNGFRSKLIIFKNRLKYFLYSFRES